MKLEKATGVRFEKQPRIGEAVSVPVHRVIYFKPAGKLKAAVKELTE